MKPTTKPYCLGASFLLVIIFLLIASYIKGHPINEFDLAAGRWIQSQVWATPLEVTNRIVRLPYFRLIYLVIIGVVVATKRYRALVFLIAAGLSEALSAAIKALLHRPRPTSSFVTVLDPTHGYSFISGHTIEYTVLFGFLGYFALATIGNAALRYTAAICFFLLAFVVGLGRVYSGAHWSTDTIGGFLLGAAILLPLICLCRRCLEPPRKPKGPEVKRHNAV